MCVISSEFDVKLMTLFCMLLQFHLTDKQCCSAMQMIYNNNVHVRTNSHQLLSVNRMLFPVIKFDIQYYFHANLKDIFSHSPCKIF